mgnify:CR=1 FL=1|tara:strand:- start:4003 stop:5892 length:1890 start_codon:yes stop_codon:yes gene_type:complete
MSYLGNVLLLLTLVFAFLQFIIFKKNKQSANSKLGIYSVYGLLISSFLCFVLLIYSHLVSDFTLINVYQNSHTTKPLLYKISGVWGNHEGSMLLWILVLTTYNYFILKFYNKDNFFFVSKALETQALIIIGFLGYTFLASNPFDKMPSIYTEGLGFNPILQDPALAIHPPLLYFGYVGFSAVFSLGVAALKLDSNSQIPWYIYMKPFVISAWIFLTSGIALGSIWAYYELGWGGWWFWDPVENASLMPWILGTALLHSLIIVHKKKLLVNWVLLLSILTFLLSILGTFLVRSGILTSVHAFALDPTRGIYILLLTSILTIYSFYFFYIKIKNHHTNNYISFFSREGSILFNNILMTTVCATIFLGTVYPLLIEVFTNNKISVGEPYFNSMVIPIMIPAILIMGIGPLLSWKSEKIREIIKKIYPSLIITIISVFVFPLFYKKFTIYGFIGIGLAMWIISNNMIAIIKNYKTEFNGRFLAHIGVGLLIIGITGSSVWQDEHILRMKINNEVKIKDYNIAFKKIKEIKGPNYLAIQGDFIIFDKNKKIITKLKPQNRYYPVTQNYTSEVSIHTNLLRDLYIVLGEGNNDDGWVVRIYYNPLVLFIWIGAFIISVGGLVSMMTNLRFVKKIL